VVALPHDANQPYPDPEREQVSDRTSDWLPADWVESVLDTPPSSAQVIEIQPGVRWTPREAPPSIEATAGATASPRSFYLPRVRLPRIPGSSWINRRHLQAMAATALVLATPVVVGQLNPGLTGTARPAAHSPFHPTTVTPLPGTRGPSAGGASKVAVGGVGGGGGAAVRSTRPGSPAPLSGGPGVTSSTSTPASTGGAPHSSSTPTPGSTPQPPGSGAGSSGSPAGGNGGGGSGSGGPSSGSGGGHGGGAPTSSPQPSPSPGTGDPSTPPPSSPASQVQGIVTSAPATVQGVASSATSHVPVP
jgi:hypothetical protein